MRCSLRLLVGALCLCLVVSGCSNRKRGIGGHNVTYEITGSGLSSRVKINYLVHMDQPKAGKKYNSRRGSDYAALPYTKDVTLGGFWDYAHIYAGVSLPKDSQATLTCTIKHDGAVVATQTKTHSVSCSAPKGAADEDN
ncbi:MAG: hypothetical protein ACRC20_15685 [Segniliparus sp.]|uniref:hypothetical protein n=1 Tax=Segniliparus sp. TaxID=2804064 RepID=UPI003F39920A